MIDLRYHVYSLAAVFFALAIGIVIGSSFVGKSADKEQLLRVSDRYERNLESLKDEVYRQRDDLRATRADLQRSETMCREMMPIALKDRLLYQNIAIIQTGDYDDLTERVKTALESVGAQVTSVTKITTTFDFEDPDSVIDVLSTAGIVTKEGERGRNAILRTVADAVVSAIDTRKLTTLEDKGVVVMSGDYSRWNRRVVIVGGSASRGSRRVELVDKPLIERLAGHGITIAGCEPAGAVTSSIRTWKRANIATVDNADRACGQVSLVCALAGEMGHFGQKRTAERKVPQTLGGTKQ